MQTLLNLQKSVQDVGLNIMIKLNMADLEQKKSYVKVCSVFCCGGGSSMGYKLAGCEVVAGCDIDETAEFHYKKNLKPQYFFNLGIKKLIENTPECFYNLDILDGSPPCSTFSISGSREKSWGIEKKFREGQAKQVLSDLFFDFIALAKKTQPKIVIAENVKGIILGNAKGYTKLIKDEFNEAGYNVQIFMLNAAFFGVPQRRERVFFVCVRNDIFSGPLTINQDLKTISCLEACQDLQQLTDQEKTETKPKKQAVEYYHKVKPGQSFSVAHPKRHLFNWKRLDGNRPANTLASTSLERGMILHWQELRSLSRREIVRLGGFPDDYVFRSLKDLKYIVGMSVPPRLTQAIAEQVIKKYLKTENE